ncbi:hypothetical protein [uncultured Thiocystis sp.]|uniref:hypothetical protein n=1 Tax=uncultured Thiocystis sp. TaxID=1202134 RepID=UPI0025E0A570|nr:hypothetical protein [uncultured Thiocystis sp.]
MTLKPRSLPGIAIAMAILLNAGTLCAADRAPSFDPPLSVERIASDRFEIALVQARPDDGAISVRGTVTPRIPHRGAIPGHIHITLIGPDGTRLAETDASPMRHNRQAQSAYFNARLRIDPPAGSTLRIAHILAGSPVSLSQ